MLVCRLAGPSGLVPRNVKSAEGAPLTTCQDSCSLLRQRGGRTLAVHAPRSHACRAFLGCAVAVPERQHVAQNSELGWQTNFSDCYSLLNVVGKGAFGVVWRAVSMADPSSHVAVKVLPKQRPGLSRQQTLDGAQREVSLWRTMSGGSRYVAQLYGVYEDEDSVYMVNELCFGDLSEVLKDGPLPEQSCAAVMKCVLGAIHDCHERQLAMIDIKPQNFLLTRCGGAEALTRGLQDVEAGETGFSGPAVVACDFGCSMLYSEMSRGFKRGGSPVFFAPEFFTQSYGLGVDEWAAGVMLYLLLTARYPFWNTSRHNLEAQLPAYQVMLAVCGAPISFSGPEWAGVSRDARNLVTSLLDRNPSTRISAQEALEHTWFKRWQRPQAQDQAARQTTSGRSGSRRHSSRVQQHGASISSVPPSDLLPEANSRAPSGDTAEAATWPSLPSAPGAAAEGCSNNIVLLSLCPVSASPAAASLVNDEGRLATQAAIELPGGTSGSKSSAPLSLSSMIISHAAAAASDGEGLPQEQLLPLRGLGEALAPVEGR